MTVLERFLRRVHRGKSFSETMMIIWEGSKVWPNPSQETEIIDLLESLVLWNQDFWTNGFVII